MLMDHSLPVVWNVVGCFPFGRPFCNVLSQVGNHPPQTEQVVTRSEHSVSPSVQRLLIYRFFTNTAVFYQNGGPTIQTPP